uniref:VOC family protein n=1 Tax=Kordiimonas sp. TaxID=1970157 RepID=UPI003A94DEF3
MAEDYRSPPSMLPAKIGKAMKETNGKFPIKICQIDQIEIRTENLAAMIKFYSGVLGCDIIQTSAETLTVRLGAGRSLIDLR